MKKMIGLFILMMLTALPVSSAGTDQKTIDFLEKLNRYYYCLSREGLKSFSCEVAFTVSPDFANALPENHNKQAILSAMNQLYMKVACTSTGKPTVTLLPPALTGDAKLDKIIGKMANDLRQTVEGSVQTWTELMLKPRHDQETYKNGCKIQNNADGFSVVETSPHGTFHVNYDRQALETSSSGTYDMVTITMKNGYTKTTKGYLISNSRDDMGSMKISQDYVFETLQGFYVPQKMICSLTGPQFPASGLGFTLAFSNYVLNR
jgi:hypothetical protein